MGLPYSKQINAAFDQVTPLVQAGFEVLQTTKDIAVFLAFLQVVVAVTLLLILLALIALLFTMNPELEQERAQLVTPFMKWLGSWAIKYGRFASWVVRVAFLLGMVPFMWSIWNGLSSGHTDPNLGEGENRDSEEKPDGDAEKDGKEEK